MVNENFLINLGTGELLNTDSDDYQISDAMKEAKTQMRRAEQIYKELNKLAMERIGDDSETFAGFWKVTNQTRTVYEFPNSRVKELVNERIKELKKPYEKKKTITFLALPKK